MKYEKEYGCCFDFMFISSEDSIADFLAQYGISVIDKETVRIKFFALLEEFHEAGTIQPTER